MSNQLGTSRATRTNKEKHAKATVVPSQAVQSPSSKTEKPTPKNQATVEQMRMALMIDSGKDTANFDTVKQLCEMTGRSEDDVVVALHDAQDDPDRAVAILIDGEQGQGEWEVQDKKKKRSNLKSDKEMAGSPGGENDRGDQRLERSRDRHDSDKQDGPPRRGRDRRNGGPPPRLANRGRGRERNNYRGDRDRDRGGFGSRNYGDQNERSTSYNEVEAVNGEEDWGAEILANREQHTTKDYREKRVDRDRGFGGDRDRSFGADRDRGFGGDRAYGDRDRSFGGERDRAYGGDRDRGFVGGDRGRSFGGSRGRGRGRGGGFGRPNSRGGRSRRYDRNDSNEGPHIDTWTNETAENAEKETSGWGDTWTESTEDWCEDQWTGSLEDTKVFTSSQTKSGVETDLTANMPDSPSTLGQRLDVGSLFSKSAEFPKAPDFTKTGEQTSGDSFFASYNQQAAESIKNSIGIGSSSTRQNLSSLPVSVPQSLGSLPAMPQRDMSHAQPQASARPAVPSLHPQSAPSSAPSLHPQSTSSASAAMLPAASATAGPSAPVSSQPLAQSAQPQQRRLQRKLPPPSKIPASAVEMPCRPRPQLDVQFGVEFGAESSQFGFGPTGSTSTAYSASSAASNSSVTNHLGESNKGQGESSRQGNIMASPPAGAQSSQSSMPNMEASPSRPSVFPDSVYSSPSKSESSASKVAEPTPFQNPAPEHKPSSLMASQRTSQSSSAISQGSLSTSKPERDSSSMPNFSVANGYAANSYPTHSQSHKPSSSSSPSQSYRQTGPASQTSVVSYPNQFPSQSQYSGAGGAQQSQYPSGQAQFPGSQGQFPSAGSGSSSAGAPSQYLQGQSQYPSGSQGSFPAAPVVTQGQYQGGGSQYHSNYQSSSVSFQNQPGVQPPQNPLYPSTTQQSGGGSYPPGSGSFHVRDSQSSGNLQQSVVSLQQAAANLQPSVVNLQQPSSNLQQSVGTLAAPAASQPSNSYQNQQPAPGLTKATTTQSTNAYNTQTYTGQPQHAQPATTQSPSVYNSQTYSTQHSSLHSQATTTQSPTSFNSQQAYSTQHSSQHGQATTTQGPSTYNTQTFSAQHAPQQNLQTSPMGNKLGDSLSKMSMKDAPSIESRTSSQYDHASNSSTAASLTSSTSTNASSISTATSTVSATSTPVVTTSTLASRVTASIPLTTKAPPNLPPGVPLVNPHLFMGQAAAASGMPPYFAGIQGLQQPLYGYEELQMLQPARLPLIPRNFSNNNQRFDQNVPWQNSGQHQQTGNFYDLAAYSGVPSTVAAGRDQAAALGTAPFTGNTVVGNNRIVKGKNSRDR
ncbi:hypothetical protein ACOMHN_048072 [Nucella lapillus]